MWFQYKHRLSVPGQSWVASFQRHVNMMERRSHSGYLHIDLVKREEGLFIVCLKENVENGESEAFRNEN